MLHSMQDEKGRMNEAAERGGEAVGKVLRMALDLVSGFGDGVKKGMMTEEQKEAVEQVAEAPAQEAPETEERSS